MEALDSTNHLRKNVKPVEHYCITILEPLFESVAVQVEGKGREGKAPEEVHRLLRSGDRFLARGAFFYGDPPVCCERLAR